MMKNSIENILKQAADFEKLAEDKPKGEYGGKGPFKLPISHKAGIKVPKGGSSCDNCKYYQSEGQCGNKYWVEWNGGDSTIPSDSPDEYCCDWWEKE